MKGKFRQDLFYRVSVLTVFIPPLRERKEDIPLLIEAILKIEIPNMSVDLSITKEAVNKICDYFFPGNVRELENILKRVCELSPHNTIKEDDISFQQTIKKSIKREGIRFPINKIVDVLIKCKGNKTKAAKQLGISRRHIYRLLSLEEKK
jgi:transcriptional regulator with PAS, ATPase and Fis domain